MKGSNFLYKLNKSVFMHAAWLLSEALDFIFFQKTEMRFLSAII
jgi:hypothetical protein